MKGLVLYALAFSYIFGLTAGRGHAEDRVLGPTDIAPIYGQKGLVEGEEVATPPVAPTVGAQVKIINDRGPVEEKEGVVLTGDGAGKGPGILGSASITSDNPSASAAAATTNDPFGGPPAKIETGLPIEGLPTRPLQRSEPATVSSSLPSQGPASVSVSPQAGGNQIVITIDTPQAADSSPAANEGPIPSGSTSSLSSPAPIIVESLDSTSVKRLHDSEVVNSKEANGSGDFDTVKTGEDNVRQIEQAALDAALQNQAAGDVSGAGGSVGSSAKDTSEKDASLGMAAVSGGMMGKHSHKQASVVTRSGGFFLFVFGLPLFL